MLHVEDQPRQSVRGTVIAVLVVVAGSMILGGSTSFGQTYLPDGINSVSNSCGGWTAFAFLLVWLSRARYALGAILGVVAFELLNEFYGIVSGLRGYFYAAPFSTIWTVVGLVAGPVLGYAAALTRYGTPTGRVLGITVPAAVWLGEGVYALGSVADTTGPVYWIVEIVGGTAAVAIALGRAALGFRRSVVAATVWLLGAAAFWGLIDLVLS